MALSPEEYPILTNGLEVEMLGYMEKEKVQLMYKQLKRTKGSINTQGVKLSVNIYYIVYQSLIPPRFGNFSLFLQNCWFGDFVKE